MSHMIISLLLYTTSSRLSHWLPAPKAHARASAKWLLLPLPGQHKQRKDQIRCDR
jgi:hypothetical protein